jgi:hypothetical protein
MVAEGSVELERRVRIACRDRFREVRLMEHILPDIAKALDVARKEAAEDEFATDAARPAELWQPQFLSDNVPIGQVLKMHAFPDQGSVKGKADGCDGPGTGNAIAAG